jgi:hypothetical protein
LPHEPAHDVVAVAAMRMLAEAGRAVDQLRLDAERVAEELRLAGLGHGSEPVAEEVRERVEAGLREDREAMAELRGDLAAVRSELAKLNAGVVVLQTHSLRQTGGVALALSVLIAIAWKVIGG